MVPSFGDRSLKVHSNRLSGHVESEDRKDRSPSLCKGRCADQLTVVVPLEAPRDHVVTKAKTLTVTEIEASFHVMLANGISQQPIVAVVQNALLQANGMCLGASWQVATNPQRQASARVCKTLTSK